MLTITRTDTTENMSYLKKQVILFLLSAFLLCGCNAPREKLNDFNDLYTGGRYDAALSFAEKHTSKHVAGNGEDLLWCLNAGVLYRLEHEHDKSIKKFDQAEDILKKHDLGENEIGETAVAAVANETLIPYTGEIYDGIMLNTYKGLSFMALGENTLARVEFNRAMDRQRRALKQYNAELRRLQDKVKKSGKDINKQKNLDIVSKHYPDLDKYEVYHDFINPFATYMAGLFYYVDGDYKKAIDYLKESAGMMPDNKYVKNDLKLVESVLYSGEDPHGYVWVVFENGLGPVREEFRVDLSIDVGDDDIMFSVALPKLESRSAACANLLIDADGQETKTRLLTSMDRIIQTEFKKDYGSILTRAILSTTSKAVMQYSLRDEDPVVRLFSQAYSALSTVADTRIWSTLPKNFQAARIDMPEDKKMKLSASGSGIIDIELEECDNAIIYVKLPVSSGKPVYDVMKF